MYGWKPRCENGFIRCTQDSECSSKCSEGNLARCVDYGDGVRRCSTASHQLMNDRTTTAGGGGGENRSRRSSGVDINNVREKKKEGDPTQNRSHVDSSLRNYYVDRSNKETTTAADGDVVFTLDTKLGVLVPRFVPRDSERGTVHDRSENTYTGVDGADKILIYPQMRAAWVPRKFVPNLCAISGKHRNFVFVTDTYY